MRSPWRQRHPRWRGSIIEQQQQDQQRGRADPAREFNAAADAAERR